MNLYADFKLLDATLKSLSGKDEAARIRATLEVKAHVETAARELSLERFAKFENELYQEIFSFVNGNTLGEKIGGILVIRELVGCTSASAEDKVGKFAKALSTALNANTDFSLIELIADALGHMARTSPVSDVDYLEVELGRALGWLRGPKQSTYRRFAACTVLQQLATSAPTIFFAQINSFFDLIWGPLWDVKEKIRISAGQALSACLAVLRERTYHLQWYCYLYDQFQEGFVNGSEEHVHGSLLVVAEALKYTGDFMIPRFKEVCKSIMALKDHRARIVRASIITLLPSLAVLCPDAFARAHMDEAVEFLLRCAKTSELRPQALLATGKLCVAVGPYLVPRIDELMAMLRESFPTTVVAHKKKEVETTHPEALLCISDMVEGLGTPFHDKVLTLLEPMLHIGLTPELIDTLSIISAHMPNQRNMVQVRLLEETCKVLGGNSKPPLSEPDYLYSWAKVGERVSNTTRSSGTSNITFAMQLAGHRSSPGSNTSFASAYPSTQTLTVSDIKSSKSARPLSLRGASLSPAPAEAGTPPKASSGFMGVMQRLGVAKGHTPGKGHANASANAGTNPNSASDNSPYSNTLTLALQNSAIGQSVIGSGLGLGSERDKKRHTSPAHDLVLLSLKTLSYLSVPSGRLILLIKNSVLPYLFSDDYCIRKEAATTCARMLVAAIHRNSTRGPSAAAIEEILSRLLEVVVSDTSSQVRLQVLQSLVPEFDRYLARTQHVSTLLLLLADEVFEIKVAATSIIGRLAHCNPASVLPPIRQQLIHLISEMQNCPDFRTIEEAAMMLCNFLKLSKFHVLVRPFMVTLIATLPLHSDFRATTAALEALGELSIVLQNDILPYVDSLLPIIITNMLDSSSYHKQEIAVKTLGQVVSSTGLVVTPYLHYPQLLPSALALLYKNSASRPYSLRMEVLRTLGLLGALEPNKYTLIQTFLQNTEQEQKTKQTEVAKGGSGTSGVNGGDSVNKQQAGDEVNPALGTSLTATTANTANNTNQAILERQLERDRADSTLSLLGDRNTTTVVGGLQSGGRGSGNNSGELRQDGSAVHALIRTEALAADDADEPAYLGMYEQSVMRSLSSADSKDEETRVTPGSEDYYPRVAVAALIKVLKDPTLSVHHSTATQTIIQIFRGLGVQCVPFLELIVPYFLQIVRRSGPGLRESILLQLSQLVAITGQYIAPYLPSIIDILKDYWAEHLEYILSIVQQIAITTAETFTAFLPLLLPLLLSSLAVPRGVTAASLRENRHLLKPIEQTLMCHVTLRLSLRAHIHLFVPALCKLLSQLQDIGGETVLLQAQTVHTLRSLISVSTSTVQEQCHVIVSVVVHTLCRTVCLCSTLNISTTHSVYTESISTLAVLAQQIGARILPFDSLILRSVERKNIDISAYRDVSVSIRNGTWCEYDNSEVDNTTGTSTSGTTSRGSLYRINEVDETKLIGMHQSASSSNVDRAQGISGLTANPPLFPFSPEPQSGAIDPNALNPSAEPSKLYLNQQNLARAWDVSQRSTATDWHEWLWKFNIDLLRESPMPTMRACAPLAQSHEAMARELFHAAFVSCWHELSEQYQDNLVRSLQKAFRSTTIPAEILQSLLNLAEFMEHDVEALPISLSILAELAQKGHAYAKALHYRELEFQTNPAGCFESLININKKLDQYDAASGLLKVVEQIQKKFPELKEVYAVQESWLAKLGHWDEALIKYNLKLSSSPYDSTVLAGKMKCLDALGRWEEAIQICEDSLERMRVESDSVGTKTLVKAAVIGARAAWSLNQWDRMDQFLTQIPADNIDGSFMRAILSVHNEHYTDTKLHIQQTRKQLDTIMTSLLTESYSRAYVPFIMVQQCSELEEIVEYKMLLTESMRDSSGENANNIDTSEGKINTTNTTNNTTSSTPNTTDRLSPTPLGRSTSPLPSSTSNTTSTTTTLKAEVVQRKAFLTEKWRRRINGCSSYGRAAIPFWKYLLNGRRMILNETEDIDTWLDFVSLCRNGGNRELAERVLMSSSAANAYGALHGHHSHFRSINTSSSVGNSVSTSGSGNSGGDVSSEGVNSSSVIRTSGLAPATSTNTSTSTDIVMDRRIRFAMLKQQWAVGDRQNALIGLESLIRQTTTTSTTTTTDVSYLSCLLKLGEWKIAVVDPGRSIDKTTRKEVLSLYGRATTVDPNCYEAWHQWGLSNYRAIEEARSSVNTNNTTGFGGSNIGGSGLGIIRRTPVTGRLPPAQGDSLSIIPLVVNSIKGLMRALTLGTKRFSSFVTQDMLCILSLWFRYGKFPDVNAVLEAGLATVHLNTWLGVLPQLIARIDHPDPATCTLLHNLLIRLGAKHAQAVVFPLFVAIKSPRGRRKEAAETLMLSLKSHSAKLIDQALLVSQELVRVAILWEENWHLTLEEAAKLFFGDGNIQAMLDMLVPLHTMIDAGANTLRESAFLQSHGNDLGDAWQCIKNYLHAVEESGGSIPTYGANKKNSANQRPEDHFLYQAWDFYFAVFKRINTQLPNITQLDLQTCSPALFNSFDLDLGVPGTYSVSGHAVRIKSFGAVVGIIRSKQRPRKLRIYGEDGQQYIFLLKGHEDLRQDERAMQLFGLVNALLSHNSRTVAANQSDFSIQRYAVMPLSPTAGLISWVPNCDTLHDLIRSYRESRKIMLDVENKLILQVAPAKMYDSLPVMHKLEVFEYALTYTAGEDLSKILWLKSDNSESWLQRRATYTRSLAVMSMVGYVLGLGDRHPSNLMLDRKTGKVLHIDFGDCFEVAMQREKFPERVPFRLTRMLVNAMEVAGIEGNYRSTCENVMEVLRENRDSLVATLEAFVHDPLISWRLLNTKKDKVKVAAPDAASPALATPPANTTTTATASNTNTGSSSADNISGGSNMSTDTLAGSAKDSGLGSLTTATTTATINTTHTTNTTTNTSLTSSTTTHQLAGLILPTVANTTSTAGTTPTSTTPTTTPTTSTTATVVTSPTETLRSAKPRPRANSKGLLGALEPIQERRRGSSTSANLDSAAAAAVALSNINSTSASGGDSECDSEYEDDEPIHVSTPLSSASGESSGGSGGVHTPQKGDGSDGIASTTDTTNTTSTTNTTANISTSDSPLPAISASPIPTLPAEGQSVPSNLTAGLLSASYTAAYNTTITSTASVNTNTMFTSVETVPLTVALNDLHITTTSTNNTANTTSDTSPKEGKEEGSGKHVAGSFKSVSFSATNQTLQSDNTIRQSSTRMEIKNPSSGIGSGVGGSVSGSASALPNISTNAGDLVHSRSNNTSTSGVGSGNSTSGVSSGGTELEVVDQYDAAARSINAVATTGIAASGSLPGGSGSAFAIPAASFRANLHLEMSSLANSITLVHQSPNTAAMANSSFAHSLSQSRMSVRGSVAQENKLEAMVGSTADGYGVVNDLQQELIEKAVVVIRRVMDKLTGLDFADQHTTSGVKSPSSDGSSSASSTSTSAQQLALEVPDQVDRLIREATSNENLSQSFFGWCPFW